MPEQASTDGPSGVLEPLAVSVKEAARQLGGINPYTVYRMLDAGELEEMPVRGRRLVTYRSLVALLPPVKEAS